MLEKNYIGAGGSGRNTTIIRSNYRTPEGIRVLRALDASCTRGLSQELDFNLMLSTHGHFTLAHTDSLGARAARARRRRTRLLGVDSQLIGRDEIARALPASSTCRSDVAYPIQAALYHPPGAVMRHDAVVWGYAHRRRRGRACTSTRASR